VVIATDGLIVRVNGLDAVVPEPSLTRTVKLDVPVDDDVPETVPETASERPGGNEPDSTDQLYPPVPPAAEIGCEYATPTVPLGSDAVATESGWMTVIPKDPVAEAPDESLTTTPKLNEAAIVGVPEIAPDDENERPSGIDPAETDQV
jgi:hypothetical protein